MANRISDAELAQVQQRIQSDPRVRAILDNPTLDPRGKMYRLSALAAELTREGVLPASHTIGTDGRVSFNDGADWMKWAIPATAIGTLGTATALGAGPLAAGAGTSEAAAAAGAPAATEAAIFGSPAATAAGTHFASNAARSIPWGDIARTAIPVAGAVAANAARPDPQPAGADMPPELRELLALQLSRIKQAQPNYDLMLNMARGMTPKWARESAPQGGSGSQMSDIIQRLAGPR